MKLKRGAAGSQSNLVSERIMAMAMAGGPGAKLPTVDEMCETLDTSRATLNNALRHLEERNFICRRQGSGIFVSKKIHRKNIHVLINASYVDQDGASPFWGTLWGQLIKQEHKRAAYKNEQVHFQLISCGSVTDTALPDDITQLLAGGRVDGLITIGMSQAIWLVPKSVPMISFAGMGHWFVETCSEPAIAEAVRRLASLGCGRIVYWSPFSEDPSLAPAEESVNAQFHSFRQALVECGLPYFPRLDYSGQLTPEEREDLGLGTPECLTGSNPQWEGYKAAKRTFQLPRENWPDGIVITDDMMTLGVVAAFRMQGIRLGTDVKVASHSNAGSHVLFGWERDLLLWKTDPNEIAAALFTQLDRLMAGEDVEQFCRIDQRFPDN